MVVNRKGVTLQQDPFSAGFCVLEKFEARIGGGVVCPNGARLLHQVITLAAARRRWDRASRY
jgi:hypothetical protein